jgi:hypothetical protein
MSGNGEIALDWCVQPPEYPRMPDKIVEKFLSVSILFEDKRKASLDDEVMAVMKCPPGVRAGDILRKVDPYL